MKLHSLLSIVATILFLFIGGFAQAKKCDGFDKNIKYKVLFDDINTKDSHTELFLEIYIEPNRFTVDSMLKLAERLKTEYCDYDSIKVRFYNTAKLEKMPDPPPQPLIHWVGTPMRGFYEFDRKENKEELFFRVKRKDKEIDVEIIFKSDGYCIVEKEYKANGR